MGCGAVVLSAQYGEVKRMFVKPKDRRHGVGNALLRFLEQEAVRRGCTLLRLETGVKQPAAIALYERSGFTRRGPFGSYPNDPLCVFMEKRLGSRAAAVDD